jgi:hypothetical protein
MFRGSRIRSYCVAVSPSPERSDCWSWEIHRSKGALETRLPGDGFGSYEEAKSSGTQVTD